MIIGFTSNFEVIYFMAIVKLLMYDNQKDFFSDHKAIYLVYKYFKIEKRSYKCLISTIGEKFDPKSQVKITEFSLIAFFKKLSKLFSRLKNNDIQKAF